MGIYNDQLISNSLGHFNNYHQQGTSFPAILKILKKKQAVSLAKVCLSSLLDLDFPGLEVSNFPLDSRKVGMVAWWWNSTSTGGWTTPLKPLRTSFRKPTKLRLFNGLGPGCLPSFQEEFIIPSKNEKHISNEFNCFKKTGLKLLFYNSLEIASPEIKQETNKKSTIKDTPKTGWCFFTNPFETYAKVKLDHFPR